MMFVNGKLHRGPMHDFVNHCHHSDKVMTRLVKVVPALLIINSDLTDCVGFWVDICPQH